MSQLNGDFDPKACYGRFGDPKTTQHATLASEYAALEGANRFLEEEGQKAAAQGRADPRMRRFPRTTLSKEFGPPPPSPVKMSPLRKLLSTLLP